jgi:hypothetical protein
VAEVSASGGVALAIVRRLSIMDLDGRGPSILFLG